MHWWGGSGRPILAVHCVHRVLGIQLGKLLLDEPHTLIQRELILIGMGGGGNDGERAERTKRLHSRDGDPRTRDRLNLAHVRAMLAHQPVDLRFRKHERSA